MFRKLFIELLALDGLLWECQQDATYNGNTYLEEKIIKTRRTLNIWGFINILDEVYGKKIDKATLLSKIAEEGSK